MYFETALFSLRVDSFPAFRIHYGMEGGKTLHLTYFLAANSGQGFYSLYEGFPDEAQFLHIIKGGPGTGKSGFMRRILEVARARGLDTVSVLCSGDPDSLDALSVPALGQAWVDGTAPHVREPRLFGVDADYVNLGHFCRLPLNEADRLRAEALGRAYRERYAAAYELLAAAEALEKAEELPDAAVMSEEIDRACRLLDAFSDREGPCVREKRFLSAISCRGLMSLSETVNSLCKQIYCLRGGGAVLEQAASYAEKKCGHVILCPSPLRPRQLEAVLLPELSVALLVAPAAVRVSQGERLQSREALSRAVEELAEAKRLHDKLEAVYRPYMDFNALTAFTDDYVETLFQ